MSSPESTDAESTNDVFATTRWTQVVAARGDSAETRQALSDLCEAYYRPVVNFLRREGRDEDAARELAHEFFASVIERHSIGAADPQLGRFRSYLLGALKHFVANRRAHEARQKRGGHIAHEPLTTESDTSLAPAVAAASAPASDASFDREWALSILDRAFQIMKREADQNGTLRHFEVLKAWLTGEPAGVTQAAAAGELGMNEGAVRVAIHRLRRRFREIVRAEIAHTVDDRHAIGEEMRHLIAALSE